MRRRKGPFQWQAIDSGWQFGRYAITLQGSRRWALEVDGTVRSEHRRAVEAAAEAQIVDRSRRRWLKVSRNVAAIAVATILAIVGQATRSLPNEAYGPARDSALTLEAAYRSVATRAVSVLSFTGSRGITGGAFTAQPPINFGETTAPTRSYEALVATHEGECYVIRWSPNVTSGQSAILTGVLSHDLSCEVHPRLIQYALFARASSQSIDGTAFDWEEVLPPPAFEAAWFIPLVIAVLFVFLQGVIGISLAMIVTPKSRVPIFAVAASGKHPLWDADGRAVSPRRR